MKDFNARAWSAATGRLRSAGSANDLVRRTLAQHELMPDEAGPTAGPLECLTARLRPMGDGGAVPILEGASFLDAQLACDAGSRRYRTYVPASASEGATGLIVMLHGCTQTPEDFAAGTGMNDVAEEYGFIVVYPQQSRGENAQTCWNWFRRSDQRRNRGEPAILAGLARQVAAGHGVPGDRIFVAGLSAGAAMSVILGEIYPDVFSGVGAHSGLPAGSAKDVPSAFATMAWNGTASTTRPGTAPVQTIVPHGTVDATVHPCNGQQIVQRALDLGPPAGCADRGPRLCPAGDAGRRRAGPGGAMGDRGAGPCLVGRLAARHLHRRKGAGR